MAEYRAAGLGALDQRTARAVSLMRSRRSEEAREELAAVEEELEKLTSSPPEWRSVLLCSYRTSSAYRRYLAGEFAEAKADLDRAQEAITAAIEEQPLLLPLAHRSLELCLQQARVVRGERKWDQVRQWTERILALGEDRQPLGWIRGEPLYLSALWDYLLALPDLDAEDRQRMAQLGDRRTRFERLRQFSLQLYAPPDLLIPYP